MLVHEIRDAGASSGGKAHNLARLIAAGLDVPPGFVIDAEAFRRVVGELPSDPDAMGHALEAAAHRIASGELPDGLDDDVTERCEELGDLLVVRSSALIEDGATGAAPGVFASVRDVARAGVWQAIRAVWTSALAPLAVAYARRVGAGAPAIAVPAVAVIVQRQVAGERVTVYTHSITRSGPMDEVAVQRGTEVRRFFRQLVPKDVANQHAVLQALRCERALEAEATGVDVELVQAQGAHDDMIVMETWVVQARPIVQRQRRAPVPPPPIVLEPLRDGRTWTWDIEHNPDPLSPAQAGLVERVTRAELAELRVCAGYLYGRPSGRAIGIRVFPDGQQSPELVAAAIGRRATELEAACERILAVGEVPSIGVAIERYLEFYKVWAHDLAPLIAEARRQRTTKSRRLTSVEAILASAARGELTPADVEQRLGDLAPAWDVAVAPFGERPDVLREAIAHSRTTPGAPREPATKLDTLAAELAERDDLLFARAQRLVRRALLARGAELGIGDDVFWLPLDEVAAGEPIDPATARKRAAAARAAAERAAQWQMPRVVGPPSVNAPASPSTDDPRYPTHQPTPLAGAGSGTRVVGGVVRFASLASAAFVGRNDIVVVRAITPALAVFVTRCAALVSETGGLLDHGAAMARELGITYVVGCRDACTLLEDGMRIAVDGDAGTVSIVDEQ